MSAQFLRSDTRLTPVSRTQRRALYEEIENACQGRHANFFRPTNRVITFRLDNVNYRIDVDTSTDDSARQQMHLASGDAMLYAQLQTGSGQTIANIIYPANQTSVRLDTLIDALKRSIKRRAIFTAIH